MPSPKHCAQRTLSVHTRGVVVWHSGLHHTVAYSSPSTLGARLGEPSGQGSYLLSPQGSAMYFITYFPAPHVTRKVSRFTCLWEVVWKEDGVQEHFAFWSPENAPRTAQ